jgi:hypothetical protein
MGPLTRGVANPIVSNVTTSPARRGCRLLWEELVATSNNGETEFPRIFETVS